MPPASFGVAPLQGFVGHGRVAYHEDGDRSLVGLEGWEEQEAEQEEGEIGSTFHEYVI